MLVARIDHALTRGINWLTTCLVERARGYDSSEAGDYLVGATPKTPAASAAGDSPPPDDGHSPVPPGGGRLTRPGEPW